ncbi:LCP family protein [Nocardioides daejeonensis]|uniref:LCP family protein n=1 Tax=Nocardioides daejeonensis TaxID=1046556 RepID=UPI000D746519|nr:LCP family protein [Nocardioides daejeonensis]
MADRPGPEPGTPEYDWLYGDKRRPVDDPTQVLPSQSPQFPPPQAPRQQPAWQQPYRQPPPPGTPPPRTQGGFRMPRPRFRPLRWILLLLALWLVFLAVVPFFALRKVSTVDAFPDGKRPAEQDGTTYLIVGSDSREGLSKEQRKKLGTGDAGGQRTDTIMLLHTGSGPNVLTSIPRDSLVPIPDHGTSKINAAYAWGGPQLLIETIEDNTGIRIDHYVEIGFGGFVDVVDAVGGIEICPERRMRDKDANLNIKKGCQQADGVVALGYARSRKTDPALGDITRARHQREVVSAVGTKVLSPWTVVNPFRYWKLNMAAASTLKVSEGTGAFTLGKFAMAMTSVDKTCGIPISDLAVHWDADRSKRFFQHIIEDDTAGLGKDLCTPSGLPG